ncbi:MAG TPA: twin-arginine translocase TatA/TatE family subunit [Dermatophilaceae bacterium]|nr:twin-arginine translocase TatA/TatE family subunit [Dermatophilaceae bacterium]
MFDINAWEAVIILAVALIVIGPDRLPEYAARLGRLIRRGKETAEGARAQLREQMGPEFDDINWRAYDPRQYDPRRIVREALDDPPQGHRPTATDSGSTRADPAPGREGVPTPSGPATETIPPARGRPAPRDPALPTPFDEDAT